MNFAEMPMKKVQSHGEYLSRHFDFAGKAAVDIGCGTGDFVRWMTEQGAAATGVDSVEMIARVVEAPKSGDEKYLVGTAQDVPLESGCADAALYLASFHHIPAKEMRRAIEECMRILKPGGTAIFVEPVGETGSYYEVVRLVEDERDIQAKAYEALKAAGSAGLRMTGEGMYYLERSFQDYMRLLELFVGDASARLDIAAAARAVTERLSRTADTPFESYRYRSICRMNILKKRA
jgi:ubiquinone/menaquinone biosynthesis C-methylase UbiE